MELQDRRLRRIRELAIEIATLEEAIIDNTEHITNLDPNDVLPSPVFYRSLNALEKHGIEMEERLEDLKKRRDLLLAVND